MTSQSERCRIIDHIGHTPLLELTGWASWAGVPEGTRVLAKAEHLNPGGSSKDRIALALLADAEAQGLGPGGIVVEATSGNTGIALAQACAAKDYRLHVVASEKVSTEKVRIIEAFGHTVHRTPLVGHDDPDHYTAVAPRLAKELGGFYLDQFHNDANVRVHETHTGPEITGDLEALGLRADAFVSGVGTGGTLTGVARHLAAVSPDTRIVLADPAGSVLAGAPAAAPYKVEGIGDDAPPSLWEDHRVDGAVTIDDRTAFEHALAAARLDGVFVGGSAGCHLAAAAQVARTLPPGSVVVTVLPDTGRNYLSTFFDPAWCAEHGFTDLHAQPLEAFW